MNRYRVLICEEETNNKEFNISLESNMLNSLLENLNNGSIIFLYDTLVSKLDPIITFYIKDVWNYERTMEDNKKVIYYQCKNYEIKKFENQRIIICRDIKKLVENFNVIKSSLIIANKIEKEKIRTRKKPIGLY